MTTSLSTARTIEIDGMTGPACVQKVTGALKGVPNVETTSVTVGAASIKSDQTGCDAACRGIGSAGFKARESVAAPGHEAATNPASKPGMPQHGAEAKPHGEQKPAGNAYRTAGEVPSEPDAGADKRATAVKPATVA